MAVRRSFAIEDKNINSTSTIVASKPENYSDIDLSSYLILFQLLKYHFCRKLYLSKQFLSLKKKLGLLIYKP